MKRLTRILTPVMICALAPALFATGIEGEIELEPAGEETDWGYSGPRAPQFWADLDPEWALCGDGVEQSPIDIQVLDTEPVTLDDLEILYRESPVVWLNNGHTVEFEYEHGSTIMLDGEEFELLQFHFHGPSEHTLQGGARFPLEGHFVHRSASGELAVIGVMIREGARNTALPFPRRLRQYVPTAEGVVVHFEDRTLDASGLLPDDLSSYRYVGSLTTPPCSEGVNWIFMATPVEWSRGQMRVIQERLEQLADASNTGNNRPTQPLNGRTVERDSD